MHTERRSVALLVGELLYNNCKPHNSQERCTQTLTATSQSWPLLTQLHRNCHWPPMFTLCGNIFFLVRLPESMWGTHIWQYVMSCVC